MTLDCGQHTEPTKRTSVFETGHPATKMQGVNRQMCYAAELTKTQTAPGSVLPEERWMETTTRCPLSWKGLMLHIKQSKEIGNLIVSHSLTPPNISEFDSLSLCQSKTRYNPIFLTLDLASSLMSLRCPNFWQCCFKLFWLNLIPWMLIIRLVSSSTIKRKSPATQMADLKTTSHFMKEFFFFFWSDVSSAQSSNLCQHILVRRTLQGNPCPQLLCEQASEITGRRDEVH